MVRGLVVLSVLALASCGGADTPAPKVSRAAPETAPAIGYAEFRNLAMHDGDDLGLIQKRFIMLDRDNNGVLTRNEYSGY